MSRNGKVTYFCVLAAVNGVDWQKIVRYPTLEAAKVRARGINERSGEWVKVIEGSWLSGRKVFAMAGTAPKKKHGWGVFGSGS